MRAQIDISPYNIDMFDEVEEGSLLIADKRTANALVDATVHAITAGSVKRVGVLFTIDAEAIASPSTLLKVNLAIRSGAAGLFILKPRTDRLKTPRPEGGAIPFNHILVVAAEINRAFTKLGALLQSTRGNLLLAIHSSWMVKAKGPLPPAKLSLKIASTDMDDCVRAAMEAPTAPEASTAWAPAKPTRGKVANLKRLQANSSKAWNRGRGRGRGALPG